MLNFGERNSFVLTKRLAPLPLGIPSFRFSPTSNADACHRFGGAAISYQRQGAPVAVSGSAIWENHPDSVCQGAGLPPKVCNVGAIAGSCELLKFMTKGCEL
jgi:hypothetical protein